VGSDGNRNGDVAWYRWGMAIGDGVDGGGSMWMVGGGVTESGVVYGVESRCRVRSVEGSALQHSTAQHSTHRKARKILSHIDVCMYVCRWVGG